jgi:hypothetical protein
LCAAGGGGVRMQASAQAHVYQAHAPARRAHGLSKARQGSHMPRAIRGIGSASRATRKCGSSGCTAARPRLTSRGFEGDALCVQQALNAASVARPPRRCSLGLPPLVVASPFTAPAATTSTCSAAASVAAGDGSTRRARRLLLLLLQGGVCELQGSQLAAARQLCAAARVRRRGWRGGRPSCTCCPSFLACPW